MKLEKTIWALKAKGNGCVTWATKGERIEVTFYDHTSIEGILDEVSHGKIRITVNGGVLCARLADILSVDTNDGYVEDDGDEE